MIKLLENPTYLIHGTEVIEATPGMTLEQVNQELNQKGQGPVTLEDLAASQAGTISYGILEDHNQSGNMNQLALKFDYLTSHDITYVGIIQTAMASGLKEFPVPYILTNCHNSLNAVGGTINEDDHAFGLSAAKKYGGIFVPPHQAVIHSYMREMYGNCGKMIMGSDSHTRYGALGTLAVGEGGPEIAKQLLKRTYDVDYPSVVGVYLTGELAHGVGPQDVALAIIGAVFKNDFVKNAVMEFVGPGVEKLSVDFRHGVDVMTTETTCWSSIWQTDELVKEWLTIHGRGEGYQDLKPRDVARYDRMILVELDKIRPMIALPFHPSNVYTIEELKGNTKDIFAQVEKEACQALDNKNLTLGLMNKVDEQGRIRVDQGIIAGCSGGTYENLWIASQITKGASIGSNLFSFSVYPGSQPISMELMRNGAMESLMQTGAIIRTAFCGPCFGAGDTPSNQGLSIRHTTRNFPNREGSKPGEGQIASVALMDARSIAATAKRGGFLTSAAELDFDTQVPKYHFDPEVYENRVYQGFDAAQKDSEVVFGPNITPWPEMEALGENLLLKVAAVIHDPVTTTDELMPSGETSSFRSNPIRLSDFTLSRKDPEYLGRTRQIRGMDQERIEAKKANESLQSIQEKLGPVGAYIGAELGNTQIGSVVVSLQPGDGSAREQAASGQKVLGGFANIAVKYATKRYRNNLINWGMLPFLLGEEELKQINKDEYLYFSGIRKQIEAGATEVEALLFNESGESKKLTLSLGELGEEERAVLLAGSLINYYGAEE